MEQEAPASREQERAGRRGVNRQHLYVIPCQDKETANMLFTDDLIALRDMAPRLARERLEHNAVHLRPSFPRKRESRDGGFGAAFLDSRLRGNDEILGLCAYLNCIGLEQHREKRATQARFDRAGLVTSTPARKYRNMKPRLCAQGGVANARDTTGYRCALRLALNANPSVSFVPILPGRCTRSPNDDANQGLAELAVRRLRVNKWEPAAA